jgi:uncharacterized membrane protein YfhO
VTWQGAEPGRLRFRVRAEGDAFLVIADAWHPGWRAVRDPDGVAAPLPLYPADLFVRGVVVPAGEYDVELRFEPASLRWGAWISLLGLAALAWLWLR